MSHNLEYLLTRPGALKITTIVIGIAAVILCSHSYGESPYTDFYEERIRPSNNSGHVPGTELELANMTSTIIMLGASLVFLTAHSLFYIIVESRLNKFIDITFHLCGALSLFAGGTSLIYSAVHIKHNGCDTFYKIQAGPIPKLHHSDHFLPLPTFLVSTLDSIFYSTSSGAISSVNPARGDSRLCHYFGEKIVGGSLNLLNGVIYGLLALVIQSTDLEEL